MEINRNLKITAVFIAFISMLFISADKKQDNEKLVNPGHRINTEGNDFSPSVTADGSIMVFDSKKPEEKSYNIFICYKRNGYWGDPFPVFTKNSGYNDETPFISADGKTILFASDRPGGLTPPKTSDGRKRITFDIYISRFAGGRWSEPELLRGDVNTLMNERSPSLSRDGKYLFFSRWPFNNISRSKIYRAVFENGKYTAVSELPKKINSGSSEIGFIPSYRDNGRYYFSSMRAGGFGGWDIYYTAAAGKKYSDPVNAGKGINGEFNELYYSETPNSRVICSDRFGGLGGYDIYINSTSVRSQDKITDVRPAQSKTTHIHVRATDSETGKKLPGMLFMIKLIAGDDRDEMPLRSTETKSGNDGSFDIYPKSDVKSLIIEPLSVAFAGSSIRVRVNHGMYQEISFTLKKAEKEKEAGTSDNSKKSETVKPPEKAEIKEKQRISERADIDEQIIFKSIYFETGSSVIKTEFIPVLYTLIEYMRNNGSTKLRITGYADSSGNCKVNNRISYERALAAKRYLVSMNIDSGRIRIRGAGRYCGSSYNQKVKPDSRFRRIDFRITE